MSPGYAFLGGSVGMPLTPGKLTALTAGEHRALRPAASSAPRKTEQTPSQRTALSC